MFLPVRYPGIGAATPSAERLSRSTSWSEKPSGYFFGSGQKVLATDASEIPMLEIRELVLGEAVA